MEFSRGPATIFSRSLEVAHFDDSCFWHSFRCIGTQINGWEYQKCCQILRFCLPFNGNFEIAEKETSPKRCEWRLLCLVNGRNKCRITYASIETKRKRTKTFHSPLCCFMYQLPLKHWTIHQPVRPLFFFFRSKINILTLTFQLTIP